MVYKTELHSIALLLALIGASTLLAAPRPQQVEPLPASIVSSWQESGATPGWIWADSAEGYWRFTEEPPAADIRCRYVRLMCDDKPEALRAFRLGRLPIAAVNALPSPGVPFGLWLDWFGDPALRALAERQFPELRAIVCCASGYHSPVNRTGFDALAKLRGLRWLQLENVSVPEADGWIALRDAFPDLERLTIPAALATSNQGVPMPCRLREFVVTSQVSLEKFEQIVRCKQLEVLRIRNADVPADGWPILASLGQLKTLDLRQTRLDDAALSALAAMDGLESLILDKAIGRGATPQGAARLSKLKRLRRLDLGGWYLVDDAVVQEITRGGQLEWLNLSGTAATDNGMRHLASLKTLQGLGLVGLRGVSDQGCRELAAASSLTSLDLTGTKVTNECVAVIAANLHKLRSVSLGTSPVGDAGLKFLDQLEDLRTLFLFGTAVTDKGVRELKWCRRIETLDLSNTRVTGLGLDDMGSIETLDVRAAPITDRGAKAIGSMTRLRSLDLSQTGLSDTGLRSLGGLRNLVSLNLQGTRVGDAGLEPLSGLLLLRALDLTGTRVGDRGISAISNLRRLQALSLIDTRVTTRGTPALRELRALQSLVLPMQVSDSGVAALYAALPGALVHAARNSPGG